MVVTVLLLKQEEEEEEMTVPIMELTVFSTLTSSTDSSNCATHRFVFGHFILVFLGKRNHQVEENGNRKGKRNQKTVQKD
jgi:hypothetical protein